MRKPTSHLEWTFGIGFRSVPTRYAYCADGIVRAFRFTGEADTVWTRPARVSVNGRTVTGFVTCDTWAEDGTDPRTIDGDHHYRFTASAYGRNHSVIPGCTAHYEDAARVQN